jgi:flagellar motor switch protein FliN/FliY
MADDDKTDVQNMSEDEKLAAEWEAAMGESGADSGAEPDSTEDNWDAAMAEAAGVENSNKGSDKESNKRNNVRTAPMEEFGSDSVNTSKGSPDLDVIMDIPVTISMEVGNTMIPIRNLLQLNQGSVIELDRLAGEPLDVLVNGTLIAHGEVVMVNDKFGIRLTDVISLGERIKRLQK